MKKLTRLIMRAAAVSTAAPVWAQTTELEAELRAEINRLKAQVVRAEALLQRMQAAAPVPVQLVAATPPPVAPKQGPARLSL